MSDYDAIGFSPEENAAGVNFLLRAQADARARAAKVRDEIAQRYFTDTTFAAEVDSAASAALAATGQRRGEAGDVATWSAAYALWAREQVRGDR